MPQHHVTEDHLKGFGSVIMYWAILETLILYALAPLLKTDEERAMVAFWHIGYNDRRDVMRTFVQLAELDEEAAKEFECLIVRMNAAYSLRNTIAHSVWAKGDEPNSIVPQVMKARGKIKLSGVNLKEEKFTPERLAAEASKITRLTEDFIMFAKKHLGMVPDANPEDASLTV
ncbi:MAG: hypothetical protein GY791_16310 [Alphaproteobacteria bacterium]|nr:hypothetical protein [Alphaproteobacteria bacterium]